MPLPLSPRLPLGKVHALVFIFIPHVQVVKDFQVINKNDRPPGGSSPMCFIICYFDRFARGSVSCPVRGSRGCGVAQRPPQRGGGGKLPERRGPERVHVASCCPWAARQCLWASAAGRAGGRGLGSLCPLCLEDAGDRGQKGPL